METKTHAEPRTADQGGGPTFHVNIEGEIFAWDKPTITVTEIRGLGDLPHDVPVQVVDLKTNEQRTLAENEVIELRPGLGFSKKVRFVRG